MISTFLKPHFLLIAVFLGVSVPLFGGFSWYSFVVANDDICTLYWFVSISHINLRSSLPGDVLTKYSHELPRKLKVFTTGLSIKYVRKIFRKTNISNPRTCAYQGVRNVSFSEYFAYALNGWPLTSIISPWFNFFTLKFWNSISCPCSIVLFSGVLVLDVK